jgi:hypothetical protein
MDDGREDEYEDEEDRRYDVLCLTSLIVQSLMRCDAVPLTRSQGEVM